MTHAIDVRGLTIHGTTASGAEGPPLLRGVDLSVAPGEVVGLSGPSGSGKSTLLHALLGHLSPGMRITAGTVRVHGADPLTPAGRRLLRGRVVGHMPQDPASALDPARTALHHLRSRARRSTGHTGRADLGRLVLAAAHDAQLDPALLRRRGCELSGGQAQRVILAALLIGRPAVVLLDEPTSDLDAETADLVARRLADLPWLPALVLASHAPEVLERSRGRVLILRDGALGPRAVPVDQAPARTDGSAASRSRAPDPAAPRPRTALDRGPDGTAPAAGVEVAGLRIRLGADPLLDGGSFRIPPGGILALRGRSGSGKTSVGRALAGLLVPEEGELHVAGRRIPWSGDDRRRAERMLVGLVLQDSRTALHPEESVRTAIVRAGRAAVRQGSVPADPAELLERLDLDTRLLGRRPHELSGGQRQRVAIARAMAAAPTLLVCDEVTASLDPAAERRVLDALDDACARTGLAVLLITHSARATHRAHQVLTLDAGRLA